MSSPCQIPNVFAAVCHLLEPPSYYPEQEHDTKDGGPLPPMHPNSSSLSGAVPPHVEHIYFESERGRNDGIQLEIILSNIRPFGFVREEEDAAAALGCWSKTTVYFQIPGIPTPTAGCIINIGSVHHVTIGMLLSVLTCHFYDHMIKYLNDMKQDDPWLDVNMCCAGIRVRSLDRDPEMPNVWWLNCSK